MNTVLLLLFEVKVLNPWPGDEGNENLLFIDLGVVTKFNYFSTLSTRMV